MAVKKILMSLTKINPADLEYSLEEMASKGLMLENIGEAGFFYFTFLEKDPVKCRYVVDYTELPKAMYMETLISEGWEYLGKSCNCYIWRKTYEEERPVNFADRACLRKHCFRMQIGMIVAAIICFGLAGSLLWGISYEHQMLGAMPHLVMYSLEAVLQIPLIAGFIWSAVQLDKGKKAYM